MPTAVLSDATSLRPSPDPATAPQPQPPTAVSGVWMMAPLAAAGFLGTKEDVQHELDGIAMAVRAFHLKQPDQVMKEVAAYTARLTELVVLLHRVEALDRQYTRVRTAQVEKWLVELERQFKIASRLVEVNRQDLAVIGGQV